MSSHLFSSANWIWSELIVPSLILTLNTENVYNTKRVALCLKLMIFFFIQQDKTGTKARQGSNQVKETIQEYIAGAETVTDDPVTRDYVVIRARLMAAK